MADGNSQRRLRVGVVGLGWAGQSHMQAYDARPDVELVAIAGQEPDRLEDLGARFSAPARYESWEALVESPELDAISVAVPNFLHAPISCAALKAGLHVLCEKPLGRSADEAATVVQAARTHGRVIAVGFNKRDRPSVTALKKLIEEGLLGKVYYVKAYWLRRNAVPPKESWFTSQEAAGGGALVDTGVHVLDMALHVLGEPRARSVSAAVFGELGAHDRGGRPVTAAPADKQSIGASFDVEDFASALIRLEDGAALQLETSWAGYQPAGARFGLEVLGTEAGAHLMIHAPDPQADRLTVFGDLAGIPAETAVPYPPTGKPHGGRHAAVVASFIEQIQLGTPLSDDDEFELLTRSSIIDACYASASSGQQVPVMSRDDRRQDERKA